MLVILRREESSLAQENAHHPQIICLDDVVEGPIHVVLAGWFCLTLKPEKLLIVPSQRNRAPGLRYARNTGKCRNLAVKLANRSANCFRFGAHHGGRKRESKGHGIVRIETRIGSPQVR